MGRSTWGYRSSDAAAPVFSVHIAHCILAMLIVGGIPPDAGQDGHLATEAKTTGPFLPDAQQLFSGCNASANGPNSRLYECKTYSALITHHFAADWLTRAKVLELSGSAFRSGIDGSLREEKTVLNLAGKECPSLRFSAAFGVADVTVVSLPNGDFRAIQCVAKERDTRTKENCSRVLEYLAFKGAPEPIDIAKHPALAEPKILSRKLDVPKGCQLVVSNEVAGMIKCDSASSLTWNVLRPPPAAEHWLSELTKQYSEMFQGEAKQEKIACKVEGAAGQCARLSKDFPRGKLWVYVGTTAIEGTGVMVTCTFFASTVDFDPVCNRTITATQ
jgi:hypothetical protein